MDSFMEIIGSYFDTYTVTEAIFAVVLMVMIKSRVLGSTIDNINNDFFDHLTEVAKSNLPSSMNIQCATVTEVASIAKVCASDSRQQLHKPNGNTTPKRTKANKVVSPTSNKTNKSTVSSPKAASVSSNHSNGSQKLQQQQTLNNNQRPKRTKSVKGGAEKDVRNGNFDFDVEIVEVLEKEENDDREKYDNCVVNNNNSMSQSRNGFVLENVNVVNRMNMGKIEIVEANNKWLNRSKDLIIKDGVHDIDLNWTENMQQPSEFSKPSSPVKNINVEVDNRIVDDEVVDVKIKNNKSDKRLLEVAPEAITLTNGNSKLSHIKVDVLTTKIRSLATLETTTDRYKNSVDILNAKAEHPVCEKYSEHITEDNQSFTSGNSNQNKFICEDLTSTKALSYSEAVKKDRRESVISNSDSLSVHSPKQEPIMPLPPVAKDYETAYKMFYEDAGKEIVVKEDPTPPNDIYANQNWNYNHMKKEMKQKQLQAQRARHRRNDSGGSTFTAHTISSNEGVGQGVIGRAHQYPDHGHSLHYGHRRNNQDIRSYSQQYPSKATLSGKGITPYGMYCQQAELELQQRILELDERKRVQEYKLKMLRGNRSDVFNSEERKNSVVDYGRSDLLRNPLPKLFESFPEKQRRLGDDCGFPAVSLNGYLDASSSELSSSGKTDDDKSFLGGLYDDTAATPNNQIALDLSFLDN